MAEGVLVDPVAAEIRLDGLDLGSRGPHETLEAAAATKIAAGWRRYPLRSICFGPCRHVLSWGRNGAIPFGLFTPCVVCPFGPLSLNWLEN